MLDLSGFWPRPPDFLRYSIVGAGFEVSTVTGRQVLVSGDVGSGLGALLPGAPLQGPHAPRTGKSYGVRLGFDRALVFEPPGAATQDVSGWSDRGFAATDVTDVYQVLQIEGPAARAVLARATGVDLRSHEPVGGGSALLKFAEVQAIVYRFGPDGYRLHVERSHAAYVWSLLETLAEVL